MHLASFLSFINLQYLQLETCIIIINIHDTTIFRALIFHTFIKRSVMIIPSRTGYKHPASSTNLDFSHIDINIVVP